LIIMVIIPSKLYGQFHWSKAGHVEGDNS
jgi:hypothetical protein